MMWSLGLVFASVTMVICLTAGSMAVRSVSRIWLRHYVERRLQGSAAAITYLERPQRLLLAAATMTSVGLVWSGELLGLGAAGWRLLAALSAAAAVVILAQAVGRGTARRWSTQCFSLLAPLLHAAELTTAPLLALARALVTHLGGARHEPPAETGRELIQELLVEGELEGVGRHDELAIISGVVSFSEKVVKDVMTGRDQIFAVAVASGPRDIASRVAESAYTRVPIYRESLDEVAGIIHTLDVLKTGGHSLPPIRPVVFVQPELPLNNLFFRMLRERVHLAIVRNGAGHTIGLVTLEDLLEELVGDIRDEHDEPAAPRPQVV